MSIAPIHANDIDPLPPRSHAERWSYTSVSLALRAVEFSMVALTALAALLTRFDAVSPAADYGVLIALGLTAFALLAQAGGCYHIKRLRSRFGELNRLLLVWSLSLTAVLLLCFAAKTTADYSRIWFGAWWLFGMAGLVIVRLAAMQLVRQAEARGRLTEQAILVGDRRSLPGTRALLDRFDLRLLASIHPAELPAQPEAALAVAAGTARRLCESLAVDRILLAPNLGDEDRLRQYVDAFKFLPVETVILPPNQTLERALAAGTNPQVPALETVARRPLSDVDRFFKRLFDLLVGSCLLVGLSPLLLVLAGLVKLDSQGPVFFRQQRAGFGGSAFIVWKFRTMFVHECQTREVRQARRDDPRVTRLGWFLRRTSLDELPQLFNVIRGEMSLVGPRPHAVAHDAVFAQEVASYLARHRVKPGMTGLAQVKGFRGEISSGEALRQRVSNDLWYTENWSILLDLRILLLTAFVLAGRNAY